MKNINIFISLAFLFSCGPKVIKPAREFIDPKPLALSQAEVGEDTFLEEQWSLEKLQAASAWEKFGLGNKNLRIALIGSGVDYNHPDLSANIGFNTAELNGEKGVDDDGNGYVDDIAGWDVVDKDGHAFDRIGHGTAQAGIIGAVHNNSIGIKGLNSHISMIPIRYINEASKSSPMYLIKALEYALKANVSIVSLHALNLSLILRDKTSLAPLLSKVLKDLHKKDIPIIVNAGSSGVDFSTMGKGSVFSVLSNFSNVMVATSCDEDDTKPLIRNFGFKDVLTCAPGESIYTTAINSSYKKVSGSYLASAHLAGMIALLKSYRPVSSVFEIVKNITTPEAGDVINGLGYAVRGSNRINVDKFLSSF